MTLSFQGRLECEQAGGQEADVLGAGHLSLSSERQPEGEFQEPRDIQTYAGNGILEMELFPLLGSGERHPLP